jgi:hypothetical protein
MYKPQQCGEGVPCLTYARVGVQLVPPPKSALAAFLAGARGSLIMQHELIRCARCAGLQVHS